MRLLLSLGVAAALVAGVPASSATVAHPVPVAIAFWDAQHGLAALTTFTLCGLPANSERVEIERTTDGGRTWARVHEACASEDLETAGAGSALLPEPRGLLRTSDRGATWARVTTRPVGSLSFVSPSLGWGVRGGLKALTLLKTRDGGRTWRPLGHHPCTGEKALLSFVSSMHGWLLCVGEAGAGNQGKAIYETRNGGASWLLRARAPFGVRAVGTLGSYGYPTQLVFRGNGRGWMPQLRGATLTTRDGGRTWKPLRVTAPEARIGVSVSFVSDRTGFILVQDEVKRAYQLERTDDGARTWRVVHAWHMP